jgi:hypothetical protein
MIDRCPKIAALITNAVQEEVADRKKGRLAKTA